MKFIQIGPKHFVYDEQTDELYIRVADMIIGDRYEPLDQWHYFNEEHYASFSALKDEFRENPEQFDRYKTWVLKMAERAERAERHNGEIEVPFLGPHRR